jgi:sulfide:quinone oxidoreductase
MSGAGRLLRAPARVVVVGGGVAGLETCLALRAFGGDRVHVTLIAPNRYFVHRPVGVRDPLAVGGRVRTPLARLASVARAELRHDRLAVVDSGARRIHTTDGYELPYDALVVAVGALSQPVPARAEPFDEDHTAGCRVLMHRLREGRIGSLAFVEPAAPSRAFDLYDLAIDAAVKLRSDDIAADLVLVTAAAAPLAILGVRAAGMLRHTLRAHGVRVVESAYVRGIGHGEVELAPLSRRILAERVIAAPRLWGPWLEHLPCDAEGFIPVDPHGRVRGVDGVYAAGDCTSFPAKHPSLAAQQGDSVATAIAADAGLPVAAEPFTPVLRGMLPSRLRWYVDAPLTGGMGDATEISALPLWTSSLRFDARFLAPHVQRAVRGPRASAPRAAATTVVSAR